MFRATVQARILRDGRPSFLERLTPFGKYYLLERINVGGMAEVFKAKTVGVEGFEKIVAIKRILPSVAEDEEFIKMFIDEAKITSQLSHANLAQTFDLGKTNDAYYIAMEYVPGKDLRAVQERLRRRGEKIPLPLAAYVVGKVCEGLDYAHRKRDAAGRELNIVHRDVSPQNVIISYEGEVKLVDFGIAKAANKITKTQSGILKGKFGYMSPEQVRGLPLDRRSDIFAAGVVLYELCTGERLFTGSSDFSVLEKVQQAKITRPSVAMPDMPERLETVILKALAREPEERYQHAADLSMDLTRFLIEHLTRSVTRDDISAFMKTTFPDEDARERNLAAVDALEVDPTRTRAPRKGPPPLPPEPLLPPAPKPVAAPQPQPKPQPKTLPERPAAPKREPAAAHGVASSVTASVASAVAPVATPLPPVRQGGKAATRPPPRLPASLTAGIPFDDGEEDVTTPSPPPENMSSAPKALQPPPLPGQAFGHGSDDRTDPGLLARPAEDEPTRPMSMDELAAAERVFAEREKRKTSKATAARDVTVPGGQVPGAPVPPPVPPSPASVKAQAQGKPTSAPKPAPIAARPPEPPARAAPPAPAPPAPPSAPRATPNPVPPSRPPPAASTSPSMRGAKNPPLLPASLLADVSFEDTPAKPPPPTEPPASPLTAANPSDETDPRRRRRGLGGRKGEAPRPAGPRQTQPTRPPEKLAPFGGRMVVSKPTLVGNDPVTSEEDTVSTLTRRARWMVRGQLALVALAIGGAVWAWLSVPHTKEDVSGSPPAGSLSVTTEPEDAIVLLDGAQVKTPLDRDFTEPKLSAGVEHIVTVRREGFSEQVLPLTLLVGEKKMLPVKLQPLPGQLTVRSSPGGAQVFLDGNKVGVTPAYLPDVKQAEAHAIVLEKKCFRTWQVAIPANAGKREVAATLEPIPGACLGLRAEKEEKPAPELPLGDPAAMASLGFLSLGSRPSANVVIDGVDIGRTTPLQQWPLKVGKHKIKLVVGGKKKEFAIEVRSGQTVSEIIDLRKIK